MSDLPFSIAFIQLLADGRSPLLTGFFQLATFIGEVEGYVLIITGIYVMWDKRLAFHLSVLVLLTMCVNHVLKIIVKNPRPFMSEGTWTQKWAVSADKAADLATEYSTPSGHAMAAAAFYSALYVRVKTVAIRVLVIMAALLTGLSRPYLGVHYLEDVLIGWVIGLGLTLLLLKHATRLSQLWNQLSHRRQATLVVVSSVAVWIITVAFNGRSISAQPLAFVGYAGFLTGIVIGHPLEMRRVRFDPASSAWPCKLARYAISALMIIATLILLDQLFGLLGDDSSLAGHVLQYTRYIIAGVVAMYVAPLTFIKLRLAEVLPDPQPLVGAAADTQPA